jgi:hypothetical protein
LKAEQVRRTIALVVDDLSLSFQSTRTCAAAVKKYVDEQMRDGDLVAIIRTGAGIGARCSSLLPTSACSTPRSRKGQMESARQRSPRAVAPIRDTKRSRTSRKR